MDAARRRGARNSAVRQCGRWAKAASERRASPSASAGSCVRACERECCDSVV